MARNALIVEGVAPPQAHYSHAVVGEGRWLCIAGQVPVAPDGSIVEGDATAQAEQVLANLQAVLAAAGAGVEDVVRTTVYLTSRDDRAAVGAVRRRVFADPPPANTLLVVVGLADPRFLVEIDAVAVLP